jgi:hypothetical protein
MPSKKLCRALAFAGALVGFGAGSRSVAAEYQPGPSGATVVRVCSPGGSFRASFVSFLPVAELHCLSECVRNEHRMPPGGPDRGLSALSGHSFRGLKVGGAPQRTAPSNLRGPGERGCHGQPGAPPGSGRYHRVSVGTASRKAWMVSFGGRFVQPLGKRLLLSCRGRAPLQSGISPAKKDQV